MDIILILINRPFAFIHFVCIIEYTVILKLMWVLYVGVFVPYVLSCDNTDNVMFE